MQARTSSTHPSPLVDRLAVSTQPWHSRKRSSNKPRHYSVGITSSPVRSVSIATELAHCMNSSSEAFFISVRKYTRPMASVWIRVALIKISSRGPLLRVDGKSPPKTGADTWLLAKSWWKKYERKLRVRGLRTVKSTGWGLSFSHGILSDQYNDEL